MNLEHAIPTSEQSATGLSQKASGRKVKRYIHCSDGVYEEFSSDEEGVYPVLLSDSLVDPVNIQQLQYCTQFSFVYYCFTENDDLDAMDCPCVVKSFSCL